MKTRKSGIYLRPLRELNAEIEILQNYYSRLVVERDLVFKVERMKLNPTDHGLMDAIAKIACAVRGVKLEQLFDGTRPEILAHTRFIIFYVARNHASLTLERIAKHFNMDHGSVISGIKRAEDFMVRRDFAKDLKAVETAFLEHIESQAEKINAKKPCQ